MRPSRERISSGQPRRIVITRRFALDVRDGINIFVFALADALLEDGHAVDILATRVGDPARLQALYAPRRMARLHEVEPRPTRVGVEGLTAGWLGRGRRWIHQLQPHLVINNGALPFGGPEHTCNLAHDLGWATAQRRFDRLRTWYKRYAYARGDEVVALCPEVGQGLSQQLGIDAAMVRVIPPTVRPGDRPNRPVTDRDDVIVHTGTGAYKDPGATIRAFAALQRSSTRLIIEGDVTPELRGLVAGLPTATRSRIELVGQLSATALGSLLETARVAAFPTAYTVPTASATVVEAIVAGTPIVGSTVLSRSVLDPGVNGISCADDAALARAFGRLLDDDDAWDQLSAGARALAPRFDARTVAASYLALPDEQPVGV